MKKFKFLITLSFFLLNIVSIAEAAYGPYLSFDVGGYSRRVEESCSQCVDPITLLPVLKIYGNGYSTRLLGKLGMDLQFLDVYLSFGGSSLKVDEFDGFNGKMSPAVGGGVKIIMYEAPTYEHFKLFINPEFFYFKTSDNIQIYSQSLGYIIESHDILWTEYGVKIGGSARYEFLEPYGGVSLSFLNGNESGPVFGSADFKESDNLGFFFGANYYLDPTGRASLYGEIAGGDNNYLKVGIKTRF
jgi:hypothetical protein